MPPKRKSDAFDADDASSIKENDTSDLAPVFKKSRVDASTSTGKDKAKALAKPLSWEAVELEKDDEGCVPVYDDCAEVRRKIRLLQKTPGWKVGAWLKDIGNINSNSYGRFMKETGKTDGASNGTYYAAYVYFEKVRIAEGKKKTAKRLENEKTHPHGFPLENRRYGWGPK